jgi:uncharacterized membrane protein
VSEPVVYRRLAERPQRDYETGAWTRRIRTGSLALAILGVVAGLVALPFLPDEIPVHFGITGEADRWGSRWELLVILGVWVVVQVGMDLLSRHPRLVNFPGPLTSENVQRLYRAAERMLVHMGAGVALIFAGLVGEMAGAPLLWLVIVGLVAMLAGMIAGFAKLSS